MDLRSRIMYGAGELFTKHGVKSVTMDYISCELGISKRTIYENFKDKNDLIEQILIEGAKKHKEVCFKIVEESENVIEAIFNIGKVNHETFGKINPLFLEDLKKYHPKIFTSLISNGDFKDVKLTYTLLERGKKEGLILENINIDAANIFIHEIFTMVHKEKLIIFGREVLYESIFLPYWFGISTKKGREIIEKNLMNLKKMI